MNDLSWMDPPIEVAACSPRLEMIMARLKSSGLRPYKATEPVDFNNQDPLLIDISSVSRPTLERVSRARDIGVERTLIMLSPAEGAPTLSDAMVVKGDSQLALIPGQLAARRRRAARQCEVLLRRETAAMLGENIPPPDPDAVPEVLFLGDGSPFFMDMQGALKQRSINVTAALSAHTAMDYIAANRFALAMVDVSPGSPHAATFMALASSDGSLAGLPILAIASCVREMGSAELRALDHATEIIERDMSAAKLARRIEILARQHLASTPLRPKQSMSSIITCRRTGLFSRKFMELHLERQLAAASVSAEPICIVSLKVSGNQQGGTRGALKRFAPLVAKSIRETDCASIMTNDTVLISLPATPYRGGVRLAERIVSEQAEPSQKISWRVIERRKYHTARTLISAALSGPYKRTVAA